MQYEYEVTIKFKSENRYTGPLETDAVVLQLQADNGVFHVEAAESVRVRRQALELGSYVMKGSSCPYRLTAEGLQYWNGWAWETSSMHMANFRTDATYIGPFKTE